MKQKQTHRHRKQTYGHQRGITGGRGSLCGSAGKESAYNAGDLDLIPGLGRSSGEGERLPTPIFWPGEFHGLYSLWGCKELDMTEQLSLSLSMGGRINQDFGINVYKSKTTFSQNTVPLLILSVRSDPSLFMNKSSLAMSSKSVFCTRKCLKCTLHQFLQISEHQVSLVSSSPAEVHIISGPVVVTLLCCGRWEPLATRISRVILERYE